MGLFGGGNSKKTTNNVDNRVVNDYANASIDNSTDNSQVDNSYHDSSQSYEDNSYRDNSRSYEDNSYRDNSTSLDYEDSSYRDNSITLENEYEDNSYHDSSTSINGEYAGNSGSIVITDSGAFNTVSNSVSQLVALGNRAFQSNEITVEALGRTANEAIDKANLNSELMKDITGSALSQYNALTSNANGTISKALTDSLTTINNVVDKGLDQGSKNQELMRDVTQRALMEVSEGNKDALLSTQKLMTSISTNGNDLLIDGVVKVVKYVGGGLAVFGLGFMAFRAIGSSK